MAVNVIQVRKKGSFTMPSEFRDRYDVSEGDIFTMIDLGDGSFLLTPHVSQVNRLGNRIAEILMAENISVDDLLASLDEEREQFYREHYTTNPSQNGEE